LIPFGKAWGCAAYSDAAMTLYPGRRWRPFNLIVGLAICLLAALSGATLLVVIGAIVVAPLAVMAFVPRLKTDASGISVRSLHSFSIPWSSITGFRYDWAGSIWCVHVEQRNGQSEPIRMLTTSGPQRYTETRLAEIVTSLREQLQDRTGTVDRPETISLDDGTTLELGSLEVPPAGVWNAKTVTYLLCAIVLGLFFIGMGVYTTWDAATNRPHLYAVLRDRGVPLTASFAGCSGGRDDICRLTVTYRGTSRTWDYGENHPQFDRLSRGDPVAVLLDPRHPQTVYTVRDVQTDYDTGVLSGSSILGVGFVIFGVAALGFGTWFYRSLHRISDSAVPEPSGIGPAG
jgi:hypothetical protein